MGLGNRGKQCIQRTETPTVNELFTPTEKAEDSNQASKIGRPKGLPTKAKLSRFPWNLTSGSGVLLLSMSAKKWTSCALH